MVGANVVSLPFAVDARMTADHCTRVVIASYVRSRHCRPLFRHVGVHFSNTIKNSLTENYFRVPPLIICRFILNLRQIDVAEGSSVVSTQSHSIRFVGNMGQSLQFGDEGEDGIRDEDAPGSDSDAPSAVAQLIVTRVPNLSGLSVR